MTRKGGRRIEEIERSINEKRVKNNRDTETKRIPKGKESRESKKRKNIETQS